MEPPFPFALVHLHYTGNSLKCWIYFCHTINVYIYIYIYIYIYTYVYFSSISSLMHIWLNISDNLYLHILVSILSNRCIVVLISKWNWLTNFPYLTGYQVLSCPSRAIRVRCILQKYNTAFYLYWCNFFKILYIATVAKDIQVH